MDFWWGYDVVHNYLLTGRFSWYVPSLTHISGERGAAAAAHPCSDGWGGWERWVVVVVVVVVVVERSIANNHGGYSATTSRSQVGSEVSYGQCNAGLMHAVREVVPSAGVWMEGGDGAANCTSN